MSHINKYSHLRYFFIIKLLSLYSPSPLFPRIFSRESVGVLLFGYLYLVPELSPSGTGQKCNNQVTQKQIKSECIAQFTCSLYPLDTVSDSRVWKVTEWQATLGEVETVLKLLLTVQRQWTSLEAIFLTSKDIRAQLPDDTRRCDKHEQFPDESSSCIVSPEKYSKIDVYSSERGQG